MSPGPDDLSCVRLSPGVRLQFEPTQQAEVLLYPEGMVQINGSAADILRRCDGRRVLDLIADLGRDYEETGDDFAASIHDFLGEACRHGWIRLG